MASLTALQGTLGHRRAAHLLRRTSFRYTKSDIDQMAAQTADQAVLSLLALRPLQLDQPVYYDATAQTTYSWINPPGVTPNPPDSETNLQYRVAAWWLNEALHDSGIGHKMAFFFHQYLAVSESTLNHLVFFDYLALLRWGCLGNFKKLVTKMIADNTMLRYLNNNVNSKTNPNENFAREFQELFTIGKGHEVAPGDYTNYTEDDIVQAAKVFTGFSTRTQRDSTDPETGIPRGVVTFSRHDTTTKTFSARYQNKAIAGATNAAGVFTEVGAFVDLVFNQPETARNFCRRLYRYFIHRDITIEIETDIIIPLADFFQANNYEIIPVLRRLLNSQHFYDADDSNNADEIIGGMIKSPLELSLQAISFFNITIPDPYTQNSLHYLTFYAQGVMQTMLGLANLNLFAPQDVAGYAAYHQEPDYSRQWFNSSTIIARYKFPQMLLNGKRSVGSSPNSSIGIKLNIATWIRDGGVVGDPYDAYVVVHDLLEYMLPETVSTERFDYFLNTVFLDNLPAADWNYDWQNYMTTHNDSSVKIPLGRLITYIMFSPEFQTF